MGKPPRDVRVGVGGEKHGGIRSTLCEVWLSGKVKKEVEIGGGKVDFLLRLAGQMDVVGDAYGDTRACVDGRKFIIFLSFLHPPPP